MTSHGLSTSIVRLDLDRLRQWNGVSRNILPNLFFSDAIILEILRFYARARVASFQDRKRLTNADDRRTTKKKFERERKYEAIYKVSVTTGDRKNADTDAKVLRLAILKKLL